MKSFQEQKFHLIAHFCNDEQYTRVRVAIRKVQLLKTRESGVSKKANRFTVLMLNTFSAASHTFLTITVYFNLSDFNQV